MFIIYVNISDIITVSLIMMMVFVNFMSIFTGCIFSPNNTCKYQYVTNMGLENWEFWGLRIWGIREFWNSGLCGFSGVGKTIKSFVCFCLRERDMFNVWMCWSVEKRSNFETAVSFCLLPEIWCAINTLKEVLFAIIFFRTSYTDK